MSNSIVLRVQSPDHGTKRINTKPTERTVDFLEKVRQEFGLSGDGWDVFTGRDRTVEIRTSRTKPLSHYKVKHGDMLHLMPQRGMRGVESSEQTDIFTSSSHNSGSSQTSVGSSGNHRAEGSVQEDEVDVYLGKQDGRIPRLRNEQLCKHGPHGKCLHCVPLEPYDEEYLKSADPPIKFLSFHSHIRKLTGGVDKGKFANLENLSCKIKPGCTEHPPWPGGICTKCQPNAVTLNRQKYRHVDYIQFENPFLVEQFLNYWRTTGNQRIGIMYGRYEPHKDVPLGIKAVVAAIYEPPQLSTLSSVELEEDEHEAAVNVVAEQLGLRQVGWIFTDLVAQDLKTGTVKHFRGNINSHFLSAEECIMAANFQNSQPNPCRLSPDGHFGSKFVTVVVTGDKQNQIHFEGYQVSNQCMALVRDDCLVPTHEAPELGYVKESSNEQYVPDVFYKIKDEYGNEVTQLARPLPVEYLLLDMPAAFPVEPLFTFHAGNSIKPFTIENRAMIGQIQDFNSFTTYMSQFSREEFLNAVSDFHVLIYMAVNDALPIKDKMGRLLEAVTNKDEEVAYHWSKTEEWGTVQQLMEHTDIASPGLGDRSHSFVGANAAPLPPIGAEGGGGGGGAMWTCKHCTFLNQIGHTVCEMCALPQ